MMLYDIGILMKMISIQKLDNTYGYEKKSWHQIANSLPFIVKILI